MSAPQGYLTHAQALSRKLGGALFASLHCGLHVRGHEQVFFSLPGMPAYSNFFRLLDRLYPLKRLRRFCIKPYNRRYFPLRLHTLDDMARLPSLCTPQMLKHLKEPRHFLLIDISAEAVTGIGLYHEKFMALHRDLQKLGVPQAQVFLLNANASKSFYTEWASRHSPDYRIRMAGYHFYIYAIMQDVITHPRFPRLKQRLLQAAKSGHPRPKHFMCLNLKTRAHRAGLMSFLFSRGFEKLGIISYIGENEPPDVGVPIPLRDLLAAMPDTEALYNAYLKLEQLRPIEHERPAEGVKHIWHEASNVGYLIPELHLDAANLRFDTYFEIVTETHFTGADTLYITEKTLRPMLRLQPFIHLGSPHVLAELKRLGFRTFAPYINEAYDKEETPQLRLKMACEEIARLCALPLPELHELYAQCFSICEHNFEHLCSHFQQLFCADVENNVFPQLFK